MIDISLLLIAFILYQLTLAVWVAFLSGLVALVLSLQLLK